MTQKLMKGAEFWPKTKFLQKLNPIFWCVGGLSLWTGAHLHIRCDSHYFMFFSAHSTSQHQSMFSSICLVYIDQPSRTSVCLTSATTSSSSGNYLVALHCLLIFMSTCSNICFRHVVCQRDLLPCFTLTSCPLSLTQRGFSPECVLNWWLHYSNTDSKLNTRSKLSDALFFIIHYQIHLLI